MDQPALAVHHRQVEPGIVGPEPRRPEHTADRAVVEPQVEPGRVRHAGRRKAFGRRDALGARVLGPFVDGVEQPAHLQVGQRAVIGQPAREQRLAVADGGELADDLDPGIAERVQVEAGMVPRPGQLQRGHPAGALDVVDLGPELVQHAGRVHPPLDVAPAIEPGHADMLAGREPDLPARGLDLVRQLHAGGRAADHQHAALGQVRGAAIVHRRDRGDARRQLGGTGRNLWQVAGAAGQHDDPGLPVAPVGPDVIAAIAGRELRDPRLVLHRGGDGPGIARQHVHDLGHVPVAVRVVALVAIARQAALPVGRQQGQRVPALGAP